MKGKLVSLNVKKEFEPITLEITIESVEEARSLFHVFNYTDLGNLMKSDWYSSGGIGKNYSIKVSRSLGSSGLGFKIKNEIENQGYEV